MDAPGASFVFGQAVAALVGLGSQQRLPAVGVLGRAVWNEALLPDQVDGTPELALWNPEKRKVIVRPRH